MKLGKKGTSNKKRFPQQVYLRKEDHELVLRAASIKSATLSSFIREAAVKEARKVLQENITVVA